MLFSRLVRLALGELGDSPFGKFSSIFCLTFVAASALILLGVSFGLEEIVQKRLVGDLPNYIRVEADRFSLGPLSVDSYLSEANLQDLRAIDGVKAVYRLARLERPASLKASYADQNFVSDILVDAVDRDFINQFTNDNSGAISAPSLESGPKPTSDPPLSAPVSHKQEVECLLSSAVVDALLSGVSIHTDLPNLNSQALIGRHFTLEIGHSTFSTDSQIQANLRCKIVGISPLVGVSGPNIPYDLAQQLSNEPLKCQAALVYVEESAKIPYFLQKLESLRLKAPGVELAQQASQALTWIRLAITIFSILLSCCAGFTLYSNLNLEIKNHSRKLALYIALGAAPSDIGKIYLIRSLATGLTGAFVGLILGCLGGNLINKISVSYSFLSSENLFITNFYSLLAIFIFTVTAAVLFCLFPIYKGCRLGFENSANN